MSRFLLAFLAPTALMVGLTACGGPVNLPDDTGRSDDTGDTDTADPSETGDTGGPDISINPDAAIGLYHTCGQAEEGNLLTPGTYSGTTDGWAQNVPGDCVAGGGAGPEKLFSVEVGSNEILTVSFKVTGNDSRIYLLEDCHVSGICLMSTNGAGADAAEVIEWTNESNGTRTVFVVADMRDPSVPGDAWTLTVGIGEYVPPVLLDLADNCGEIDSVAAVDESGTFNISLDGFDSTSPTGSGGDCSTYQGAGKDGMLPILVPNGGELEARWVHSGCDPVLYLYETCGDSETCLDGSDSGFTGGAETVTWQNRSGDDATVTLVMDSYGSSCPATPTNPGSLQVTLTPPAVSGADDCTAVTSVPDVTSGSHYLVFDGTSNDVDLVAAASSCTGNDTPGRDITLPVTLTPGQVLDARIVPVSGDPALYLLSTCGDADSCVAGTDTGGAERLTFKNETGSSQRYFLVVDSRHAEAAASAPTAAELVLELYTPLANEIALSDSCGGVDSVPELQEGTWDIVLDRATNDMDLGYGNACTGDYTDGPDAYLPVTVRAGDTLDLVYTAACDAAVYLTDDCDDAGACLVGADDYYTTTPEHLVWTNDTGRFQELIVAFDSYYACRPTRATPANLVVTLIEPPPAGADTCADAADLDDLAEGSHPIDFTDATDTLDLADATCDGAPASSQGADLIAPITVPARQGVRLSFDPLQGSPILYLVEDCGDVQTCLAGTSGSVPSQLVWENEDLSDAPLFLVLDDDTPSGTGTPLTTGFLDVAFFTPTLPLAMGDTCAEADSADPVPTGIYTVDLAGFADHLDLDTGNDPPCTDGQRTPGNDGFVRVTLGAGKTLEASWDASSSTSGSTNGSLYLLEICNAPDSCLVGSDAVNNPEYIEHTNTTGSPQTLYLAVDSWSSAGGPNQGVLDVLIR